MILSPLVQAQASRWYSFERKWSVNALTLKFFDPSLAYTKRLPFLLQKLYLQTQNNLAAGIDLPIIPCTKFAPIPFMKGLFILLSGSELI